MKSQHKTHQFTLNPTNDFGKLVEKNELIFSYVIYYFQILILFY